jgi:hypothetical protein
MADVTHTAIDELDPVQFLAHDHASEGPGNPPARLLGQEEVYGTILPGPDGLRLLALSGTRGRAYDHDATA